VTGRAQQICDQSPRDITIVDHKTIPQRRFPWGTVSTCRCTRTEANGGMVRPAKFSAGDAGEASTGLSAREALPEKRSEEGKWGVMANVPMVDDRHIARRLVRLERKPFGHELHMVDRGKERVDRVF
jgi:hypothetical protein